MPAAVSQHFLLFLLCRNFGEPFLSRRFQFLTRPVSLGRRRQAGDPNSALRRGRGTRGEAVAAAETRHRAGGAGSECTARGMRRRGQKNRAQTVRRAASPNPTRTPRASVWFLAAVRDCAERARSSASGCSPPTQRNLCALFRGKIFRAVDRQVQRQICPVREYARMIDTWVCALSGKAAGHS